MADDETTTSGEGDGSAVRASELMNRYGSDAGAIARLAADLADEMNKGFKAREKNRLLRQDIEALKGRAVPDGAVVLTGEDAKAWEQYRQHGTPADVAKRLTDLDAAAARLAGLERDATIRQAAEAHGYKASALGRLPSLSGKTIELRDVKEGDATTKRAFVDDKPLDAYLAEHEADLLPALTVEPQQAQPRGTGFVKQDAGGKPIAPQTAGAQHVANTRYAVPGKTS